MKTKVLVIEDDMMLAYFISEVLEKEQCYQATITHTAHEGITLFDTGDYAMVLLDLSLPDEDGFTVLNHIVTGSDVPIIVISSRDDDASRISALAQGAEDYLTKPFHPQELLLRIKKRLKETQATPATMPAQHGRLAIRNTSLVLDLDRQVCLAGQRPVDLTATEFSLLAILAEAGGKVVSHHQLFETISQFWGGDAAKDISAGSLPVLIHRLRKKLQAHHTEELILTVPRKGYRLNQALFEFVG